MTDIFSLGDIIIVIFFIMPGFVTLAIIRHTGLFENELKEQEMVIWSVLFSMIIFSIFSWKFGIQNFDSLCDTVFQWEQTTYIVILSVGLGFGVGYFIKFVFRRGTHRGHVWNHVTKKINSLEHYPKIRVITENKEYEGVFFLSGTDLTTKDLVILNPILITLDVNGVEVRTPQGKELFVPESSIVAINFLGNVTYKPTPKPTQTGP